MNPFLTIPALAVIVLNYLGYSQEWFYTIFYYDELMHFITAAVVTMFVSFIILKLQYNRYWLPVPYFSFVIFSLVFFLLFLWEIFEYVVYERMLNYYDLPLADTLTDVVWGALGTAITIFIIQRLNVHTFINEEPKIRQIPYITYFDSSTSFIRAVSNYLHGRDFKGMNVLPQWFMPVSRIADRLPDQIKQWVFRSSSILDSINDDVLPFIQTQRIANVITTNQQTQALYPGVMIGSPNGAIAHLSCLCNVPYLPQTFPLLVRKPKTLPHSPIGDLEWAKKHLPELLRNNPDIAVYQMTDPVHDWLMSQQLRYLRIKYTLLPEAYKEYIRANIVKGGTIGIINCRKSWNVTRVSDRHTFQFGGAGAVSDKEYAHVGDRISAFLKQHGGKDAVPEIPETDDRTPEAEWGYDTRLTEHIKEFAEREGYRVKEVVFTEPQEISQAVAEVHKSWYQQHHIETVRLLVSSFMYIEPYLTLKKKLVPYWMMFNTEESYKPLVEYLKHADPYKEIYVTLFSNGVKTPGHIPIDQWEEIFSYASTGSFIGTGPRQYPGDFASNVMYYYDLTRLPEASDNRVIPPMPLDIALNKAFGL